MVYEPSQILDKLKEYCNSLISASRDKDVCGAINSHDNLVLIISSLEYMKCFEILEKLVLLEDFNIPGEPDRTRTTFNSLINLKKNIIEALQDTIDSTRNGDFYNKKYIGNLSKLETSIEIILSLAKEIDLIYNN